jgi:ribosome-associated protein
VPAKAARAKTKAVKKTTKIKKPAVKKKLVKVAAKKSVAKKNVVKKAAPKKKPVAVTAKKAAPKKTVAKKAVIKKPVAQKLIAKKPAAQKTLTKTAERKARRAAKVPVKAVQKVKAVVATPVWPPLVASVLKIMDDAKAEQVVTVDMKDRSSVADTVVVASGRSNRHVNAIADQVVEELEKHGQKNIRIEGVPQCDWVLVDAGDIIVHVFRPEVRSFYNLEKLLAANIQE